VSKRLCVSKKAVDETGAYPSSSYSHCGQGVLRLFIHLLKTLNAPGGRSMLTAKGNGQLEAAKTWRLESDQSHLAKRRYPSQNLLKIAIYTGLEKSGTCSHFAVFNRT